MEDFVRSVVDQCVVTSTRILDLLPTDMWVDKLDYFRDTSEDQDDEDVYDFMQVWVVQPFAAKMLLAEGATVIFIEDIPLWLDYSYGSSLATYSIWRNIANNYKDYFINTAAKLCK